MEDKTAGSIESKPRQNIDRNHNNARAFLVENA
jgi:hypothetical protein